MVVPRGARIIRISTALGTFAVIVVNDLGPAADALTREIEQDALHRLHAHRSLVPEMSSVEVQRGDMEIEVIEW
jgi:hypothetical protein